MTTPLRAVHTIHSGGFYGAERVVLDLMGRQAVRGVVAPTLIDFVDVGQDESELGARVRRTSAPVMRLSTTRGISISSLRAYAQLIATLRPDVVHSHGYKPTVFHQITRLLGMHDVPLVVTAHGYSLTAPSLKEKLYEHLDVWMLTRADAVVAVSDAMERYLNRASPRIAIRTIPNGIETELALTGDKPLTTFLANVMPAEFGAGAAEPRPVVIGSAGRLVPMKNHTLLIDAYAELARRGIHCVLVILGDGPLRDDLASQWRRQIPGTDPMLVPHQERVLDWVQEMDIFCMPSGPGEGLPMSLLEAGLLGRAVVCTDSGGIADLIRTGENGILVKMGDRDALVSGLETLVADSAKRVRFGETLRNTIVRQHDVAVVEEQYADVYRSVVR
ncbi:MAG: glycosyltransferase [Gemmatimonadota bacterium]